VLDVNLPDLDGFSLCRKLRDGGDDVPVVFLTARDDPADLREGFIGGGDDYLTKPFSLEELVLRVEAVLRRGRGRGQRGERSRLAVAELVLDDDAHRVWRGEREIDLSPTEYRLLRYLLLNAGRVLSRPQIIEHVWDYGYAIEPSGVETYISYLRRKLDDRDAKLIRTVRGVGYALRAPEPAERDA
jgi:two-component system OmpR family response regulator